MQMMKTNVKFAAVLLLATVAVAGCSPKAGLSGLYPVQGKVTFNGQPVEGAEVTLTPDAVSGESRGAGGRTNGSGEFKIRTLEPDDGAYPGKYHVTVTKLEPDGKMPTTEELNAARDSGKQINIKMKNSLPEKYAKIKTSGLTYTVTAGKNSDLVIDLK
jgi:hypothetical protein